MWADGPMVGFDVETTGVDPQECRMVSAAVALVEPGRDTVCTEWLIDPGVPIPAEASAIHGVTDDFAGAVPAGQAVCEVIDVLAEEADRDAPLVVFNARFDLTVLDREARRYGVTPLQDRCVVNVIDPLVIDKWLHRYRKGSRKLDAICAYLGARLDRAHAAESDALAACRAAWVLGKRGKVIRRVRDDRERAELRSLQDEWERVRSDPASLHEAQVRWASQQAASLEEYFRRQGNVEHVDREWPVVPAPVLSNEE
jgi:DNA polymerase-3 subunit epsilon